MRENLAKALLFTSALIFSTSIFFLWLGKEPFKTYFFLFAWWSFIGAADSWLYLRGGDSILVANPVGFFVSLVPFSAFLWFVFEAFNLRLRNWHYAGAPEEIWLRWPGTFLAFGTVLPGIFLAANLLEYFGIFRKNEFSQFFAGGLSKTSFALFTVLLGIEWK